MLDVLPPLGPWMQRWTEASLHAGVLIGLVLLVQAVFGRWLTPRWRYALWGVVVLRLLLPVVPSSPASVWNLWPAEQAASAERPIASATWETGVIGPPTIREASVNSATPSAAVSPRPQKTGPHLNPWLVVWLLGGAAVLMRGVWLDRRLSRRVKRDASPASPLIAALFETRRAEVCRGLAVHLVLTDAVATPSLHGVRRPRVLLPRRLATLLTEPQLADVFDHELTHRRCRDTAANWLLVALAAAHWFNPLVWFAIARLRHDREAARDAMVVARRAPDDRRAYGHTLLRVLELIQPPAATSPAAVAMSATPRTTRRRFRQLAEHPAARWPRRAAGVLLLATLAVVGCTNAAPDGSTPPTDQRAPDASGPATHETQTYDIRDLLVQVAQFEPPPFDPQGRVRNNPTSTRPAAGNPAREELVEQLIVLIEETVGNVEEWEFEGGDSSIRELNGNLIVKTTAANHAAIVALLGQIRDREPVQVSVETLLLLLPQARLDQATALIERSDGPLKIAQPNGGQDEDAWGLWMADEAAVNHLVEATLADRKGVSLTTPRVTAFDGQQAYVALSRQLNFVESVEPADNDRGYDARVAVVEDGVTLVTRATVDAERRSVRLELEPRLTAVFEPIAEKPAPGFEDHPDRPTIGVPEVTAWRSTLDIDVPDRRTLMAVGPEFDWAPRLHEDRRGNPKHMAARRLVLLVKPTIIAVDTETADAAAGQFPGLVLP